MRVLYFYQYFSTPEGSWGTRAYEFARRWVQAGDEVTIVTGVYDRSDLELGQGLITALRLEGIDLRVVNVAFSNKHSLIRRLYSFLAYAVVSSWYALTTDADVVLASSGPATVMIPAAVARIFRRRPVVFEARDLWPDVLIEMGLLKSRLSHLVARWSIALCYRMSTRVVALSPGMKEWIERDYPGTSVSVVTNAADPKMFDRKTSPGSAGPRHLRSGHLVLFTGTIGRANHCEFILDAARVLLNRNRTDIRVVLIGDGSERSRLEREAERDGLRNVEFLDPIPKTELVDWIEEAACLLLVLRPISVLDTSSPNKLFDAFAAGRPLVQTTQGWIHDLVRDEECGLNVAPGSSQEMATAIERLCDDAAFNRRLSENAFSLSERFSQARLASEMRRILWDVSRTPGGMS